MLNLEPVPALSLIPSPLKCSHRATTCLTAPPPHPAFTNISICHLSGSSPFFLQNKSRGVLKKEVKTESKNLFLGIPWRNNPGQYVKQKDFYLPRGIPCLESTRLHWFLFRALYVIKSTTSNLFFFILCLLSLFKLKICLVPVWRCNSAGVGASSGSPITSPSDPATWNFWMLCSPARWRSDRAQIWGFCPAWSSGGFCVCAQTGTPSAAAKLCAGEAPAWAEPCWKLSLWLEQYKSL